MVRVINLNHDKDVNEFLGEMLTTENINQTKIINVIDPIKDVDGFSSNKHINILESRKNSFYHIAPLGCLF